MGLIFSWDTKKAAGNLVKHGLSFNEAETISGDPHELMIPDPEHSGDEERNISIGESENGRIIPAVYIKVENTIRLISAWEAEADEIAEYRERRGE